MKAKKSLLVVVLSLVLLAVALILPAAASSEPAEPGEDQPVSWVKAYTTYRFSDGFRGATEASVRTLADKSLKGQVVVKVLRESYLIDGTRTWSDYAVETRAFTSPDFWDAPGSPYPLAQAHFFFAREDNWPADLGSAPSWWSAYKGAAVADFVAYVPVSEYLSEYSESPPPWVGLYLLNDPAPPSIPYRFMFIDSGRSGEDDSDLLLNWLFVGDPTTPWYPSIWTDVAIVHCGSILVHVGR